jgi:hypothetical protein
MFSAGEVFHVLNREVARLTIFEKLENYEAFMSVLDETGQIVPLAIFAMVGPPHHWLFVVWPEEWQSSSADARRRSADDSRWLAIPDDPPLARNWRSWVNRVETDAALQSLRSSAKSGLSF